MFFLRTTGIGHYLFSLYSLRSMAVLVGRAKWYRRTRAEKSGGDWGGSNEYFSCGFALSFTRVFAALPLSGAPDKTATLAFQCTDYSLPVKTCPLRGRFFARKRYRAIFQKFEGKSVEENWN